MGSGWGGIGMGKPLSGQKSYVTEKYYKDEFMISKLKMIPLQQRRVYLECQIF